MTTSPATFAALRRATGLTTEQLGAHLNVTERTIRHWEVGKYPVPDGVTTAIRALVDANRDLAEAFADLAEQGRPVPIPRAASSSWEHPPGWYLQAAATALDLAPGIVVEWADNAPRAGA